MKIQTFSIIVGTNACNAVCPFCVSKMTPLLGVEKKRNINWRNFEKGCLYAKNNGVSTVLLTGKGEPTIFPDEITEYLKKLKKYEFPFIELQTNGILLSEEKSNTYLEKWYELGMTVIVISVVHYKRTINKNNYQPSGDYFNLKELIQKLHRIGFSVRLSCTLRKGGIDNMEETKNMINFAKENDVEQLSLRKLAIAENSESQKVEEWSKQHILSKNELSAIESYVKNNGQEMLKLFHGAVIYDVYGQNVCLTNALTLEQNPNEIRQLIFFPDGHLRYDWQYPGAILI